MATDILWATLLGVVVLLGWLLNLLGLPGNWVIAGATAVYAALMPPERRVSVGWPVVGGLFALAVLGEWIELLAGAAGTRRAGGSRRAAALAVVGGMAGAVVGAIVGLPLPVIGSLLAALLFAGAGALSGAVAGELWVGNTMQQSLRIGEAAFWGRLLGTLGRFFVGAIMVCVVILAVAL